MEENIKEVIEEIKASDEEKLQKVIEEWFEKTRTQGMKLGAYFISAGVYAAIRKNLVKKEKTSLRDYKRCIDDIRKIIEVQLKVDTTEQNDLETEKENINGGTAETNDNTNS